VAHIAFSCCHVMQRFPLLGIGMTDRKSDKSGRDSASLKDCVNFSLNVVVHFCF